MITETNETLYSQKDLYRLKQSHFFGIDGRTQMGYVDYLFLEVDSITWKTITIHM